MIFLEEKRLGTVIKVIGVGGAGGNAVRHMMMRGLGGVEFLCANTDAQVLARIGSPVVIQLGDTGLGAGANPSVGREAAFADRDKIMAAIQDAHMVFVTAGMGGGTGTGAAPVVAEVARELGILTVGVVTKPFEFEGAKRMRIAEEGIAALSEHVDSLIVVLNEKLCEVLGDDVTQKEAFSAADDVLHNAVAGIAEIINAPGMINVDFQDVCTVMSERGRALMGSAEFSGPDRARVAAEQAIACPLLEGVNLSGARGLLVNITASEGSLKLKEPKEVMHIIRDYAAPDATIIYGAVYDDNMGEALRVTVVATGLSEPASAHQETFDLGVKKAPVSHFVSHAAPNYEVLDAPAVIRRRERAIPDHLQAKNKETASVSAVSAPERLDIPAFLRKQVD